MNPKNLNWYKTSQLMDIIHKESALKDWIPLSLMGAIIAVLTGSTIQNAIQHHNVSEEKLKEALNDKQIITHMMNVIQKNNPEQIMEIPKTVQPTQPTKTTKPIQTVQPTKITKPIQKIKQTQNPNIEIDYILKLLLQHENLLPGQTPFRITDEKMRTWNTYLGFKINKHPNAPPDRRNFIYFVNPNDVFPAVKMQFQRYNSMPSRFRLEENPTFEQAIRKFDQSNANGKIKFLHDNIPGLDLKRKLSDFLK